LVAAAACGEPTVDIILSGTNPTGLDTSCVTAVDMWVYGNSYKDDGEHKYGCHEIDAGSMTAADVKRAITGQFNVLIPPTGLLGVEVEAHTGPCQTADSDTPTASNLIFNAAAMRGDSDALVLPISPIASCERAQIRVRPVEVMALLRTKDCNMAAFPNGSMQLGTLAPSLLDGPFYWSGENFGTVAAAGTTTLTGLPNTAAVACLAAVGVDGTGFVGSTSCLHRATAAEPGVCALANEVELAIMDTALALGKLSVEKIQSRASAVFGAVWSGTGAARTPVNGATVQLTSEFADAGEVFYVSVDADQKLVETPGATSTGPSGMFVVLLDTVVDITVTGPTGTRTVKIAGQGDFVSVQLIQL
jgi:hypothetical protein